MSSSDFAIISRVFSDGVSVSEIAIRVRNLVKDFDVYAKPLDLALELLTRKQRHRTFRALDDVSFDVAKGQVLGIIGSNGAGKSTLLKIITGVLDSTSGSVEVAGRVTAILELGLGFNPDYSGRENIYLSGLLYGMDREEVERKLDQIIDFSGLRPFIDQPVKQYSSGMHARLAFSIATAVDPEVLIIDEALAAGDAMFVHKCLRRIRELCSGGRTVLMVSHGTSLLAQLCQQVLWIEAGRIKMHGRALAVVQAYDLAAHEGADTNSWIDLVPDATLAGSANSGPVASIEQPSATEPTETTRDPQQVPNASLGGSAKGAFLSVLSDLAETTSIAAVGVATTGKNVFRRGPIFIDSVTMLNHDDRPTTRLTITMPFALRIKYHCKGNLPKETLGVALCINRVADLAPIFQWYTQYIRPDETLETFEHAPFRPRPAARGTIELAFPYMPMPSDKYILSIGLLPNRPGTWEFYEYRHLFYHFTVDGSGMDVGATLFFEPRFSHSSGGEEAGEPRPSMFTASAQR